MKIILKGISKMAKNVQMEQNLHWKKCWMEKIIFWKSDSTLPSLDFMIILSDLI